MRDLSLHILDLIENSIRADATIVSVTVEEHPERDTLRIVVEDDGSGFETSPESAANPFYTTKSGKKTGLGLSLFRAAAERAGGRFTLGRSELGGAAVEATMQLSHIDRSPLGDLAGTISSVVCTNPELDLRFRFSGKGEECELKVADLARGHPIRNGRGLSLAREVRERLERLLRAVDVGNGMRVGADES